MSQWLPRARKGGRREQKKKKKTRPDCLVNLNNDKTNPLYIRNVYIPPASSCWQGYIPAPSDWPRRRSRWLTPHPQLRQRPSSSLALRGHQRPANCYLGLETQDQPTRVTSTTSTAPDLSIASANCLPTCSWSVETSLGSDHLPIHIIMSAKAFGPKWN